MPKKILSGLEAVQALLHGISTVATATGKTLGPNGRNVVYERTQTNLPVSTRDGVTCIQQFDLEDPFEQMGARMVRGVSEETVDSAGDGTTTAAILTLAILSEGVKAITSGANPVALKRGIEKATASVVSRLKEIAIPVTGNMIQQVATISSNNDEFLGGLIATAMEKAGDDGVVTVEISRKPESYLEIVDGLQFLTGYLAPSFVNNPEKAECVLEDVDILIHEKKLATIKPLLALIQSRVTEGKSLLVIAEDVTDEALAILSVNTERKLLHACAVKSPGGLEHLQDVAALTKAKVITETSGLKLSDITAEHLGHAKRVVVKSQSTTLISDTGENQFLNRRLKELRTQVTEASDETAKLRLQSRLARLSGGIAIIKVGAATELEMLDRKDRIEDAMHATRCAKSEGVLPGGGIALLRCAEHYTFPGEGDEKLGAEIVRRACYAQIRTLAENSGKSADYVVEKVAKQSLSFGWNARKDHYEDLLLAGVLDPLKVVKVALESAASVAGLALITSTLVASERK